MDNALDKFKDTFNFPYPVCGKGWYKLIVLLFDTINNISRWDKDGKIPNPKITDIKEKYGTLRIYHDGDNFIDGMVHIIENLSSQTCEICGAEGKLKQEHGWYSTRCNFCRERK